LSLEQLGGLVGKAFPGERIEAYLPAIAPNISYQIILEKNGAVYLNQYTGKIVGVRGEGMEFLDYVHQLHIRLGWRSESDPGKKIMSWVGVAMLVVLFSGFYLWWPAK